MRFKSDKQRKAVMASLKEKSFKQLQQRGVYLSYQGDKDKDGVVNIKDCKPLDPKRQGFLHQLQVKRLKAQEEKLEVEKRRQLAKLEDVQEKLKIKSKIAAKKASIQESKRKAKQAVIDEINAEKKRINDLKEANRKAQDQLDDLTVTGKTKKFAKKLPGKVIEESKRDLKATQAFLQKDSTKKTIKNVRKTIGKVWRSL